MPLAVLMADACGGTHGTNARSMLALDRPYLDRVSLAKGFGVAASRATTLDELALQFKRGLAMPGPYLVELMM